MGNIAPDPRPFVGMFQDPVRHRDSRAWRSCSANEDPIKTTLSDDWKICIAEWFAPVDFRQDRSKRMWPCGDSCGATVLVNMRDIEALKEDDGFEGAFLSP